MIHGRLQTVVLIIFMCTFNNYAEFKANMPEWVTIYVHGTTTAVGLKLLGKFCTNLVFGKPGIHHLNEMPENALLRQDVNYLEQGAPERFCSEHFYTFGWSGKLNFSAREKAGKELFNGIKKLFDEYKKKYGFYPKLRIMTFSHGGNVALNTVKALPFFKNEHIYLELLLIACPVQKVTEPLIEHKEIDQTYVISSSRDLLQVVDFYTYEKRKYFPNRFFHTVKSNCVQIKVDVNKKGLGHIDLLRSFMIHVPFTLNMADLVIKNQICSITEPNVINCSIHDNKFRFFKGFNLVPAVHGKRKK
jgi:hypothetical protein